MAVPQSTTRATTSTSARTPRRRKGDPFPRRSWSQPDLPLSLTLTFSHPLRYTSLHSSPISLTPTPAGIDGRVPWHCGAVRAGPRGAHSANQSACGRVTDKGEGSYLVQKLQELLRNVQKDRKALLQLTLEMQGVPSKEASEGTWTSRHRQQLLGKYLCARQLLEMLERMGDREGGTAVDSKKGFTKKALPDWLAEDALPLTARSSAATTSSSKFLHPLKDMALHVEWKERQGDGFELSWLPKRAKTSLGAVQREELPVVKSQTTVTETISAKTSSPSLHSSKAESTKSESSPSSDVEEKEAQGVDALMGMMTLSRPPVDSTPEETPVTVQSTAWTPDPHESTPIPDESPLVPAEASVETPPVKHEVQTLERAEPEVQPRFLFLQAPPPQQQQSLFFQMPPQEQSLHGQASMIAGGAAFGQSSFPQSDFRQGAVSNVAPQLGSLGQMGGGEQSGGGVFNPTGFAGFSGGGFAAFARQSTSFAAVSNQQSSQESFLTAFQHTPPQGGSFGSGATGSSLFGSKPISKDDKLWEMRK